VERSAPGLTACGWWASLCRVTGNRSGTSSPRAVRGSGSADAPSVYPREPQPASSASRSHGSASTSGHLSGSRVASALADGQSAERRRSIWSPGSPFERLKAWSPLGPSGSRWLPPANWPLLGGPFGRRTRRSVDGGAWSTWPRADRCRLPAANRPEGQRSIWRPGTTAEGARSSSPPADPGYFPAANRPRARGPFDRLGLGPLARGRQTRSARGPTPWTSGND